MIAGIAFACAAIGLHDADGPIYCASGEKIRLAGVAARELDAGLCLFVGHWRRIVARKRARKRLSVDRALDLGSVR